jgi:hypothetical protein
MTPHSLKPTVEVFYTTFSGSAYNPTVSWVVPTEFTLNPLFQAKRYSFEEDIKPDPDPPFILAGPEFNTLK